MQSAAACAGRRRQRQFCADRCRDLRHPLSARHSELAGAVVLGHHGARWPASSSARPPKYYTSHSYQADAEDRPQRPDGPCHGHHLGHRCGDDLDGRARSSRSAWRSSWPISAPSGFDMAHLMSAQNMSLGPLRHRHRRGGHALDAGHHAGHRRLRPDRRQCGRQRRDEQARSRSTSAAPMHSMRWATRRPPRARASPSVRPP